MKSSVLLINLIGCCRSPCGERGLKWLDILTRRHIIKSLPVRGAWIEILFAK